MQSLITLCALLAARVNAQPGGGMVGGNDPGIAGNPSAVVTPTSSDEPLYTGDFGPWTDQEQLVGTWTSKSGMVVTGPDFYDPIEELLIEPALPGISYSFTDDGFFEEAIYQVTGNGTDPKCAIAVLIYQHGKYEIGNNGSLTLTPFESDGRQLLSDPCNYSDEESSYTGYSQKEKFREFTVWIDLYYGRYRLDLNQFDGTPVAPLYLAYKPPQMLPTTTMNPTKGGTALNGKHSAQATETGSSSSKTKRSSREAIRRSLANRSRARATKPVTEHPYAQTAWWTGVALMAAGATGWLLYC